MRTVCAKLAGLAVVLMLISASRSYADDEDVADYRQHTMKSLAEEMSTLSMVLEHRAPPDNFAVHAQVLAITAATAKNAFEPKVPGGNSKPEVWANWADFAMRLDA